MIIIMSVPSTLNLEKSGGKNLALSPVQTMKSILSFQTLSMYSNVALMSGQGVSQGPSGTPKWAAVRLSSGSKSEPNVS